MADAQSVLETVDRTVLAQLTSDLDAEMARTLVGAFVDELEGRIGKIEAALAAGDLATVAFQAHAMKSTTGTYGASRLFHASIAVDDACRAGDTAAALARARELPVLARGAVTAFRQWLSYG